MPQIGTEYEKFMSNYEVGDPFLREASEAQLEADAAANRAAEKEVRNLEATSEAYESITNAWEPKGQGYVHNSNIDVEEKDLFEELDDDLKDFNPFK